jgi:hypothetical protein
MSLLTQRFLSQLTGSFAVAACLISVQIAQAQTIAFEQVRLNRTSMTNLGDAGFWFAQFDAASPISGAAIDNNDRDSLPSWVTINPAPDTTFASTATTKGGESSWATLTLPDGEVGLSGAVVDSNTANNSNNTIRALALGAGTPSKFRFYVVTDNTAGQHDPANRLRARGERTGVFDISGPNAPPGLAGSMNGSPDVWSWIYTGFQAGDIIKLQLNSGNAAEQASIAGIMFDAVPEPSSALLLLLGALGSGLAGVRRRNS